VDTNHTNLPTLPTNAKWAAHINALTQTPLLNAPFDASLETKSAYIDSFSDEYGNRRVTDRPFLGHLFGIQLDKPSYHAGLDERLWWMVQSRESDPELARSLIATNDGLVTGSDALAIEYRTMVELCALHALWVIANQTQSQTLIARCLDAAAWHTRELQPDNAINRPWATQVFIALSQTQNGTEAGALAHLHAQTLIHNTCVSFGSPDILSALILRDVAAQLAD
jgi:hypothetical protein